MRESHIKKNIFGSLRVRLILLVLMVILPLLGLIVYNDIQATNQKRLYVLNETQKYAQNASLIYSKIIEEVRLTLYHLSLMPKIQQQDPEACSQIFAHFLKQNKNLIGLVAYKSNGDVFASVPAIPKPLNNADLPWFQRLVQSRDFVIGEYAIGRLSGKPTVVFGYPVLDPAGNLVTVLTAGLDIGRLQQTIINIKLLDEANLAVLDSDGTVILRFPDRKKLAGSEMPEHPIVKAMLVQKEGVYEGIGLDGKLRLYGFTTIGSGIEAIHISVSIPEQVAFAEVRRQTVLSFVGVGLVGVLSLLGVWLFGGILIVSPAKRLLNFTKRVADGDLTVRTGQARVFGEFGLLAHNFDQMAESLQRHDEERKLAEEALQLSEEKYRLIADYATDVIWVLDAESQTFKYMSPSIEQLLGFTDKEFINRSVAETVTPTSLEFIQLTTPVRIERMLQGHIDLYTDEIEVIHKDGHIIMTEINMRFVENPVTGLIEGTGVMRDITERKQAEEELRASEENFRRSLEESPLGVRVVSPEGETLYINQATLDIFGCDSIEEWQTTQTVKRYTEQSYAEFEVRREKRRLDADDSPEYEIDIIRKDGEVRHLYVWRTRILWDGKEHYQVHYSDITESKRSEKQLQETLDSLRKAVGTTIQVMVSAVETRDPYTSGHQIRSADLARAIATEMGLPQEKIDAIRMAGSIHDIGKLSIPAEILSKPTKLSDIELALIKEHARKGYEMLKDVESPWPLAEIVRQHHERMDGSGYPRNLKGEEICMEARILAIADTVEAMASHRPYRPGLGIDAALDEIKKNRGIFYDSAVADACLRLFREKGFNLEGIDYDR